MLPNSTERAVTISGGSKAITQCVYHICLVMSEVSAVSGSIAACRVEGQLLDYFLLTKI